MQRATMIPVAMLAVFVAGAVALSCTRHRRRRRGLGEAYDDDCNDVDGCYAKPQPDEEDCLIVGKQHYRFKLGTYRVCLSPNQEKTLFQNKRRAQQKLGCGTFACVYTSPAKTRAIKFTRDVEDVAALLAAQKTGVVPKVHAVYELQHGGHALQTDEWTPVYALVVERLKVFSPSERQKLDEGDMLSAGSLVGDLSWCSRSHVSTKKIEACRAKQIAEFCADYGCSPLVLRIAEAAVKLHDIGIDWSDVHAGNIGFDAKKRMKILDLGITGSKLLKPVEILTGRRLRRRGTRRSLRSA